MKPQNNEQMRRAVIDRLESLRHAGVMQLPRGSSAAILSETAAATKETPAVKEVAPTPPAPAPVGERSSSKKSGSLSVGVGLFDRADTLAVDAPTVPTLEILQQEVAGCTRCDELARARTQTVFGVGNPSARLCFLGEAPGADEDRFGEPFVGRAGQLLTKIIEACTLKREDGYILNMIKCRPPGNRNPLPDELNNCRGYLERQFDLIRPEFICCLGAVAAQNLLATTLSIGKLRGKVHRYRDAKVVCTYHPAFLLRSPSFKKESWEDMKFLMREMGVELG
jgi:DNA polymerase